MINECLFLPENSEHCPTSQNKHKPKMKLNSIPSASDRAAIYCFIFSKNRKHKIKWEEEEAALANDTESLGLRRENSRLLHTAVTFHISSCHIPAVRWRQSQGQPFALTKTMKPNHRAELTLGSEPLSPAKLKILLSPSNQ